MKNYYTILQVSSFATDQRIKSSYRQRVKELHPDLNHPKTDEKLKKLLELFEAYQILLDKDLREKHDLALGFSERIPFRFNFRTFLLENIDDARCCAKLILLDLYQNRKQEALRCFERYRYLHSFKRALERADYMDFLFLLAESSEEEGKYVQSFLLFGTVLTYEEEKPYFKHFRLEILAHIKYLVCYALPQQVSSVQALAYCVRALKWRVSLTMRRQIIAVARQLFASLSPEELIPWKERYGVLLEKGAFEK